MAPVSCEERPVAGLRLHDRDLCESVHNRLKREQVAIGRQPRVKGELRPAQHDASPYLELGRAPQQAGSADRRERLLFPTERGRALAERLAAPQLVRLSEALKAAGPGSEAVLRRFLEAMVNAEERPKVSSIMASPVPHEAGSRGGG
jgi:hypothetical protein